MIKNAAKPKVIAAGHICLDITPVFPPTCPRDLQQLFAPGKLNLVGDARIHLGGSVANTGLAMAFFGADVRLMGKIGRDEFGGMVTRIVESHGIPNSMIISEDSHTSYSIVLAVPGCDRIFLHSPGANDTFEFADLDLDAIRGADLFHFGYPPLMKQLYSDGGCQLTDIFRSVSKAGVTTSLDLALVDPNSPAGQADWQAILAGTLPFVDIFAPSIEELLFMLDRVKYEQLSREAGGKDLTTLIDIRRDVSPLAEKVARMGAKIILLKCGQPGIYYKTAGNAEITRLENKLGFSLPGWAHREGFEASFMPDRIVSATGAGDVTIAAFLTSLLAQHPLETCLQYAAAAGACCVEAYDSLSGLKSLADMQAKMDAGWQKSDHNQ